MKNELVRAAVTMTVFGAILLGLACRETARIRTRMKARTAIKARLCLLCLIFATVTRRRLFLS